MSRKQQSFAFFGPAPYKLVSLTTRDNRLADENSREAAGEAFTTNLCGGTCDICGTAIHNVYRIQCGNGVEFKCGSECATGVAEAAELDTAVKAAKKVHEKAQRKARADKKKANDALLAKCQLSNPMIGDRLGELAKTVNIANSFLLRLINGKPLTKKQLDVLDRL